MKMKQLEKSSIRNKDIMEEIFISKRVVTPEVAINPHLGLNSEPEEIPFDLKKESIISGKGIVAAASSLLLNIRLHNWLTNNEKDFLDNLASEKDLVFLIKGNKYFHPEELELFPAETIQSCCNGKDEAVFSQKYTSKNSDGNKIFRIRTACIDSINGDTLILGQFGPDRISDKEKKDNHFHQLVELFRNSVNLASQTFRILEKKLDTENPVVIINRTSGYIVHANNTIASLLSSNVRDLIGTEYNKTSTKMKSLISNHKMNIENISSSDMSFSIIKLTPTGKPEIKTVRKIFEETNADLRGPISTIVTAASILESESKTPETRKLLNVILDEIQDVDRKIKLKNLVSAFSDLEQKETNLQYEAENAIDCFTARKNYKGFIELQTEPNLPFVTAPEKTFMNLIYSILESHSKNVNNSGHSTVRIYRKKNEDRITISISTKTKTQINPNLLDAIDTADVEMLADKLDVNIYHNLNTDQNSFDTSIAINCRERIYNE